MSATDTLSKSKWNYRAPSVDNAALTDFHSSSNAWSNHNMYRTSTNDMSFKVSI